MSANSTSRPGPSDTDRFFLILVIALGVTLRLTYLVESQDSPFFAAPVVDARDFLLQAMELANGHDSPGSAPFWQPPLYPYFLALLCALFPTSYFVAIRLAQVLLGTVSTLLVYGLARKSFDRTTARYAATICAAYGVLIYFEGELLAVTLEVTLNLLLLRSIVRALEEGENRRWLIVGGWAGLAAIARPNILLFVVALLAWLAIHPTRDDSWRAAIPGVFVRWLWVGMGLAMVILPVTARNWIVGDDLVLISANGGINFYLGNNARQDSTVAIHPGRHWENLVAEPMLAGRHKPSARSRYYSRKAWAFIKENPAAYAQLMVRKLWRFFSGVERKRNQDVYFARRHSLLLRGLIWDHGIAFPFGLVAPLSLLGLALTWRRKSPALSLLRLYTLAYTASVLLFFVTSRYRLPVVPALIIFASWTLSRVPATIRQHRYGRFAAALAGGLLLTVIANIQHPSHARGDAQLQHDLGEVFLRKHAHQQAIAHSAKAVELEPDYASAWHNLAVAYLELQRYADAEMAARTALHWHAPRADTHLVLAQVMLATGRPDEAEKELTRALAVDAHLAKAHHQLGRLKLSQQQPREAVTHLRRAAALASDDFWIHYDLGRALHASGELAQALDQFELAGRLAPDRPQAQVAAGVVLLAMGKPEEARREWEETLSRFPENGDALANLGFVELSSGHWRRAATLLEQASRLRPGAASIRTGLQRARQAMAQQ